MDIKDIAMKIVKTLEWGGLVLVIFLITLLTFPLLPPFRGFYHTRTVLTGSMEPAVSKGSLIINRFTEDKFIKPGDIVTFRKPTSPNVFVTHRVNRIFPAAGLIRFDTKGDANPISDGWVITQAGMEGKVVLTIPLLGYVVELFKTPPVFVVLVVIPLGIYILREISGLIKMIRDSRKGFTKIILSIVVLFLLSYLARIPDSFALLDSNPVYLSASLSSASVFPNDPAVDFSLASDKKSVSFTAKNISAFDTLDYSITYTSDKGPRGITGTIAVSGQNTVTRDNLVLGSCSEGGCTYDTGMTKIDLSVKLKNSTKETVLTKSLAY